MNHIQNHTSDSIERFPVGRTAKEQRGTDLGAESEQRKQDLERLGISELRRADLERAVVEAERRATEAQELAEDLEQKSRRLEESQLEISETNEVLVESKAQAG